MRASQCVCVCVRSPSPGTAGAHVDYKEKNDEPLENPLCRFPIRCLGSAQFLHTSPTSSQFVAAHQAWNLALHCKLSGWEWLIAFYLCY